MELFIFKEGYPCPTASHTLRGKPQLLITILDSMIQVRLTVLNKKDPVKFDYDH